MKVLGFCILLYGKDKLEEAIKAVLPVCDKIVILYTDRPSQGHNTDLKCPETREELQAITNQYNCDWIEVNAPTEGVHTNEIYKYSEGYDLILRFDADEVYDTEELKEALKVIEASPAKRFGVNGFRHYWKTKDYYLEDGFQPVRFVKTNVSEETVETVNLRIHHYGYCINDELMKYKLEISGHHDEFRPNWYEDVWLKWTPEMKWLHPTSTTIWEQAKPIE